MTRTPKEVIAAAKASLRIYAGSGMLHSYPEELIRDMLALLEERAEPGGHPNYAVRRYLEGAIS